MTVRVGIVGAGGISRSHLAGLQAAPGAVVSTIYDLDMDRANQLAETCSAVPTNSLEQLLDSSDAVVVCTPTAAHRSVVEEIVGRGLAVLCEKPLAPNLADAEAIGMAVEAAGVVNQVGLPLRRNPAFAILRHLVADEANGKVLGVSVHTLSRNRAQVSGGWRGDAGVAGGGMLIEVGFHDLDLVQWIAGPVAAATGTVTEGSHAGIEDAAAVSMSLVSGASAALLAAWNEAPILGQSRRVHVVCENAEYVLTADRETRVTADGPGDWHREWDSSGLNDFAAELGLETNPQAAFIRAIQQGTAASPSIADGVAIHRILDKVYRKAETISA